MCTKRCIAPARIAFLLIKKVRFLDESFDCVCIGLGQPEPCVGSLRGGGEVDSPVIGKALAPKEGPVGASSGMESGPAEVNATFREAVDA